MSVDHNSTTTQASTTTSSLSTESITGIVFGICATVTGFVTIWQAHRAWRNRHRKQLATSQQKIASNALDLIEASTFATRRSTSFATAGPPFVTAPEACITRGPLPKPRPSFRRVGKRAPGTTLADKAIGLPSRALIADQLPSIEQVATQSRSAAKSHVSPASTGSSTTPSTRLPGLRAALTQLGLSTHEARDGQSSIAARESAVKAAIDELTSSLLEVDASITDPLELVGDHSSEPS